MATCSFNLNGATFSTFFYDGVGISAFSGNGPHRNNPASQAVKDNGPLPVGNYYIVERPSGGVAGSIWSYMTDRDIWFALFRDDGTIDDETVVNGIKRTVIRLHPKGPSGLSLGCITIENRPDFDTMRAYLLRQPVAYVPGTRLRMFGTVEVGPIAVDTLDRRYRPGGPGPVYA